MGLSDPSRFISQFSKIVPIKIAYLRYAVCGCCLCIKNANCYSTLRRILHMKKATVNDYFRHHWVKLMLFALFTAAVSFFAPLKNFQLKWLIDSKSKQEALGYMGLVFLITFTSWFFERLSRRSFTKLACGAVEQVRGQVMERVLRRPVSQYQREGDAAYLSLLTTDLRTLYDDYYMSLFNIAFWGGIMLCALGMYLYIGGDAATASRAAVCSARRDGVRPSKPPERFSLRRQARGASGRVRGHPGLSAGGRLCRPPPGCCPAGPRQRAGLPAEPQRHGGQHLSHQQPHLPHRHAGGPFSRFRRAADDGHRLHRRQHGELRHHAL